MTVYAMKASPKELCQPTSAWQGRNAWRTWLRMAKDSKAAPFNEPTQSHPLCHCSGLNFEIGGASPKYTGNNLVFAL